MSLELGLSNWVTQAGDWLVMVNTASHGILDLVMGFTIGAGAIMMLFLIMRKRG